MKNSITKLKAACKREWCILTGKVVPIEDDYDRGFKISMVMGALSAPFYPLFCVALQLTSTIEGCFIIFMLILPSYLFLMKHLPHDQSF